MNLAYLRDFAHHHGVGPALYQAAYRAANRVTRVAVWNALAITLDGVDKKFLSDPKRKEGRLLEAAAMRPYASKDNALTDAFIDEAITKKDRCYAFFDGDVLASYGWYSSHPTRLTELDSSLVLHFSPSFAYMYNGFTAPKYRGQRLHAIGMTAALEAYTQEGLKGLVSYVDSSNVASLRSCYRLGYESFGHVLVIKVGDRFLYRTTPGCRRYDFRLERVPSPSLRPVQAYAS